MKEPIRPDKPTEPKNKPRRPSNNDLKYVNFTYKSHAKKDIKPKLDEIGWDNIKGIKYGSNRLVIAIPTKLEEEMIIYNKALDKYNKRVHTFNVANDKYETELNKYYEDKIKYNKYVKEKKEYEENHKLEIAKGWL